MKVIGDVVSPLAPNVLLSCFITDQLEYHFTGISCIYKRTLSMLPALAAVTVTWLVMFEIPDFAFMKFLPSFKLGKVCLVFELHAVYAEVHFKNIHGILYFLMCK